MPVWHVSISVWSADGSVKLRMPGVAEREAVRLLRGVGGRHEWWIWRDAASVGHLRVALTAEENEQVPAGCVIADAGESGSRRKRTQ